MLAVMGAMEEEIEIFKQQMQDVQLTKKACLTFYKGTIENKEIVLVRCGIGR